MKSVEFCYWLQGFFEVTEAGQPASGNAIPPALTPHQVQTIRKHLNMVFVHEIDPSYPQDQQQKLTEIHNDGMVRPPLMRC